MSHTDNVIDIRRPVEFTIDGRRYATTTDGNRPRTCSRLAGLDPEVATTSVSCAAAVPSRSATAARDVVEIHKGTRFVSMRDRVESCCEADLRGTGLAGGRLVAGPDHRRQRRRGPDSGQRR